MRPTTVMVVETRIHASGKIAIAGEARIIDDSDPTNERTLYIIAMPPSFAAHWSDVVKGLQVFAGLGFKSRLKVITTNVKGSIHG